LGRVLPPKLPPKRQQLAPLPDDGANPLEAPATPENANATADAGATVAATDDLASAEPATWARVEAIVVAVRALVGGGMAAQTIPLLDELAGLVKRARGPLAQVISLDRSRPSRRR